MDEGKRLEAARLEELKARTEFWKSLNNVVLALGHEFLKAFKNAEKKDQ